VHIDEVHIDEVRIGKVHIDLYILRYRS
jgi:hypothetical protein